MSLQQCLGGASHVPALLIRQLQGLTHSEGLTIAAAECVRRAEFVFGHKSLHVCTFFRHINPSIVAEQQRNALCSSPPT